MPNTTTAIASIQDLLGCWRTMGSRRLRSGAELIAEVPDGERDMWMHAVFPGQSAAKLDQLEVALGKPLPKRLRAFYRGCGGMTLFMGAFTLHGIRRPGFRGRDGSLEPECVVELNHLLDMLGWLPDDAVAFACNGWDGSVFVLGMGQNDKEVVRCERSSGAIIERYEDVFSCVDARLYHLDDLLS